MVIRKTRKVNMLLVLLLTMMVNPTLNLKGVFLMSGKMFTFFLLKLQGTSHFWEYEWREMYS